MLLREEGVTFQRLKTWKASTDPDYAEKKARVEHLYWCWGSGGTGNGPASTMPPYAKTQPESARDGIYTTP